MCSIPPRNKICILEWSVNKKNHARQFVIAQLFCCTSFPCSSHPVVPLPIPPHCKQVETFWILEADQSWSSGCLGQGMQFTRDWIKFIFEIFWLQTDEQDVINFLLTTEIIPLCLRIMEAGSELSKTVATFILQKILLDETGLSYICQTFERFSHVSGVLVNSLLLCECDVWTSTSINWHFASFLSG